MATLKLGSCSSSAIYTADQHYGFTCLNQLLNWLPEPITENQDEKYNYVVAHLPPEIAESGTRRNYSTGFLTSPYADRRSKCRSMLQSRKHPGNTASVGRWCLSLGDRKPSELLRVA
ncbi:hypothetical protein AVEN_265251-1 [Araneus ventricosus]|uniref:Uncharacterized protein n=1 Tax=Araneus ventricosus TaxID=182803 RepID=A0A4Y2XAU2_ARAVE|nr:hypothetical protein AVEN_265251-1 [Araneus ventricosus]